MFINTVEGFLEFFFHHSTGRTLTPEWAQMGRVLFVVPLVSFPLILYGVRHTRILALEICFFHIFGDKVKKLQYVVMRPPREEVLIKKGKSVETLWFRNVKICLFYLTWILTGLKHLSFNVFTLTYLPHFIFQSFCLKDKQRFGYYNILAFWEWNLPILYNLLLM